MVFLLVAAAAMLIVSLKDSPTGFTETTATLVGNLLAVYGTWKLSDTAVVWFFSRFDLERDGGRWVRRQRWYAPGAHVDGGKAGAVKVVQVDLDPRLDGHRVLVKAEGLEHLVWVPVARVAPLEEPADAPGPDVEDQDADGGPDADDAAAGGGEDGDQDREDVGDGGAAEVSPGVHVGKEA